MVRIFMSMGVVLLLCAAGAMASVVEVTLRQGSDYQVPAVALNQYGSVSQSAQSTRVSTSDFLLMHWELESLGGMDVESATLVLTLEKGSLLQKMYLREFLGDNGDWLGASAVSWGRQDVDADLPWRNAAGEDVTVAMAQYSNLDDGWFSDGLLRLDIPADVVQRWIDDPSTNLGVYVRAASGTSNAYVWTNWAADANLRPTLLIEAHAPEPATLTLLLVAFGTFCARPAMRRRPL